jgi:hypothetical protein
MDASAAFPPGDISFLHGIAPIGSSWKRDAWGRKEDGTWPTATSRGRSTSSSASRELSFLE